MRWFSWSLNPEGEGTVRPHLEILVPDHDHDVESEPGTALGLPVPGDRGFSAVRYPRTVGGNLIPPGCGS